MRRELTIVFVAVATMIVVAFVVPLGLLARSTAHDRAMDVARAESARLVPLVGTVSRQAVVADVKRINSSGRLLATVVLPDGTAIGFTEATSERLKATLSQAVSLAGATDGGREITTVVVLPDSRRAGIRMFVSDDELNRGVASAWAALAGLGVAMVLLAVALADRMARQVIGPAERLAEAANALGAKDFDVDVDIDGPPELAATATAFNTLVRRVENMLIEERAMVAELAHRLRTPLARLRIDLDRITDPNLALQLQNDIKGLTGEINELIARAHYSVNPPEPIDVTELARKRFDFWALLAAEEGRRCRFIDDGPRWMAIHADELEAALDTMIENVFAHTESCTEFAMSVSGHESGYGSGCRVEVEDAGQGFTTEMLPAGCSSDGSTGLGLAIVQRLADKHCGRLTVETGSLGGAKVTLDLADTLPPD